MNWRGMIEREPELIHIANSCRRARRQGAMWFDFFREHHARIVVLASHMPTPSTRAEALQAIYEHLYTVWCNAMAGPPVSLPWDSRPIFVESTP